MRRRVLAWMTGIGAVCWLVFVAVSFVRPEDVVCKAMPAGSLAVLCAVEWIYVLFAKRDQRYDGRRLVAPIGAVAGFAAYAAGDVVVEKSMDIGAVVFGVGHVLLFLSAVLGRNALGSGTKLQQPESAARRVRVFTGVSYALFFQCVAAVVASHSHATSVQAVLRTWAYLTALSLVGVGGIIWGCGSVAFFGAAIGCLVFQISDAILILTDAGRGSDSPTGVSEPVLNNLIMPTYFVACGMIVATPLMLIRSVSRKLGSTLLADTSPSEHP